MRIRGERNKELFRFFERITARAYRWTWLAANPVLGRSPHLSLLKPEGGYAEEGWRARKILGGLYGYYTNNFRALRNFLSGLFLFRKSGLHCAIDPAEFTCVDTSMYVKAMLRAKKVRVPNLPGLPEALRDAGKKYALVPSLGQLPPKHMERILALARESEMPVLTAFQEFSPVDFCRLIFFLLCYPVVLLAFLAFTGERTRPFRRFRSECVLTMGHEVVTPYIRYLMGRALARRCRELTVLSWCENRNTDKLFYKGLRTGGNRVEIVGLQLFLFPDNYLVSYFNESEVRLGFAPDRVVANSPYHLDEVAGLPATVGCSLRYGPLFDFTVPLEPGKTILFLVSHWVGPEEQLMKRLKETTAQGMPVTVRLHPTHDVDLWRQALPQGTCISTSTLEEDFRAANIVVGIETGAMVEAVAHGIPVVNLALPGEADLGWMPDLGRDEIWFNASTPEALRDGITKARALPYATRGQYAEKYRKTLFTRPEPSRILQALGIG